VTGTDAPKNCPNPATPTLPFADPAHGTIFYDKAAFCKHNPEECASPLMQVFFDNVEKRNPWRFPGKAPVENPCGLNGGFYFPGPTGTGGEAFFGFKQGWKGTEVSPLLKKTTWVAGAEAEVAWGLTANHGGGYQYRLCRVKEAGSNITAEVSEECFQKLPLQFVGDKQWIQLGDGMDVKRRIETKAVRISKGVLPEGSTWTRNPIPPCNDIPRTGGHNHNCSGPMFTPPAPGLYGFGPGACATGVPSERCTEAQMASRAMPYGIVDRIRVPDVPAGDYILSFRWDVEQLGQVWSNCADVRIEGPGATKQTKPFSPWGGCESCCSETLGSCANCTQCLNNKSGDCSYCWKPLKGFTFGAIPQYQCLGHEGPDGGPAVWKPGMPITGGWSPGCPKCWKTENSCRPSDRDFQDVAEVQAKPAFVV